MVEKKQVLDLYERLRAVREPKGYFFNPDHQMTLELLESLLVNRERYGYMSCPCRLASGDYALDKDIICPCVYSKDDLAEYGSCFCGLYVTDKVAQGQQTPAVVPERRPPDKSLAGF